MLRIDIPYQARIRRDRMLGIRVAAAPVVNMVGLVAALARADDQFQGIGQRKARRAIDAALLHLIEQLPAREIRVVPVRLSRFCHLRIVRRLTL
ncbi:hypothetical protein [Janthinobacterium sp. PSPC2-1]|uniref:hypothetical protein n=1 Tax=unclassified Janthinobacterium TaxID=2610881 RepID=UPI003CEBA1AD